MLERTPHQESAERHPQDPRRHQQDDYLHIRSLFLLPISGALLLHSPLVREPSVHEHHVCVSVSQRVLPDPQLHYSVHLHDFLSEQHFLLLQIQQAVSTWIQELFQALFTQVNKTNEFMT